MIPFHHILVPTDFGTPSGRALDLALEMAAKFGSRITLLHVWDMPVMTYAPELCWPVEDFRVEAQRVLDEAQAAAKARHCDTEAVLARGEVWEKILQVAHEREVDLIVMGTHGRRGVSRALLGSQSERVVRLSPVPVLTVSEGGETRARKVPSDVSAAPA